MFERKTVITRRIWVGTCTACGHRVEYADKHPKQVLCPGCKNVWITLEPVSWEGPDTIQEKGVIT